MLMYRMWESSFSNLYKAKKSLPLAQMCSLTLNVGLIPTLVFDGPSNYKGSNESTEPPHRNYRLEQRQRCMQYRSQAKALASARNYIENRAPNAFGNANQQLQYSADLVAAGRNFNKETERMVQQALKRSEIPFVVALGEADHQCVFLASIENGPAYVLSEDSDLLYLIAIARASNVTLIRFAKGSINHGKVKMHKMDWHV